MFVRDWSKRHYVTFSNMHWLPTSQNSTQFCPTVNYCASRDHGRRLLLVQVCFKLSCKMFSSVFDNTLELPNTNVNMVTPEPVTILYVHADERLA